MFVTIFDFIPKKSWFSDSINQLFFTEHFAYVVQKQILQCSRKQEKNQNN